MEVTLAPELQQAETQVKKRVVIPWKLALRVGLAAAVFLLAFLIRLRAIDALPTDYDEDDYLRAGQLYAQHIAAGDLAGIINERENYEHPPMTKLAFGAVLYFTQNSKTYAKPVSAFAGDKNGGPEIAIQARPLRTFEGFFGALTAGVVALVNPLAGFLVAINSWHIKYTSQAMLEALPCLFAAFALFFMWRSRKNGDRWFWLAAVAIGFTAAGKYLYGAGAIAILIWIFMRDRRAWKLALGWVGVALLAFYVADPALWPNPVGRLWESFSFNFNYSTGTQVQNSGFGWAQPFTWLMSALPWLPEKHPEAFPGLLDGVFSLFGLLALPLVWKKQRFLALWFLVNFLFLFVWPTKWPQYILAVTVPISLLAAYWLQSKWQSLVAGFRAWRSYPARQRREIKGALVWLLPTMVLLLFIVIYPLILQTSLSTTSFEVRNLKEDGIGGLLGATGRGLLGIAPAKPGTLFYSGTGVIFYTFMDESFMPVLRFNIIWVAISMALATAFGLWLASLLQRRGVWGKMAWRTLFILPWAIPEFVGAMIWSTIFDDISGGLNNLMRVPGDVKASYVQWLSEPNAILDVRKWASPTVDWLNKNHLNFLGEPLNFLAGGLTTTPTFWVMVIVAVWVAFPFMMLVSTVALRGIPPDIYDAAGVDGARGWRMWSFITWPLIRPTIWSGVLLRGILLFNAFHLPLMLGADTQRTGTTILSEVAYGVLRYGNGYSVAALINTIILAVAVGLIWLFNRQTKVVEGVNYV